MSVVQVVGEHGVFLCPVSFLKVIPGNKEVTCWPGEHGGLSGPAESDLEIRFCGIGSSCVQQPYLAVLDDSINEGRIVWGYETRVVHRLPSALVEPFVLSIFSHETFFFT